MEIRGRGEIVGTMAEHTDTISTRQTVTKAQFPFEIPQVLCLFCLLLYCQHRAVGKRENK